jgi:hypothetical protein
LDDGRYIAAFVYITSIVIAAISVSSITLSQYINTYATIYSIGPWFVNCAILGLLYVPKVILIT